MRGVMLFSLAWAMSLNAQTRTERLLEKGWTFTKGDSTVYSAVDFNDKGWQKVTIPHDWAIYGPFSIDNDKQNTAIQQDGQKVPFIKHRKQHRQGGKADAEAGTESLKQPLHDGIMPEEPEVCLLWAPAGIVWI